MHAHIAYRLPLAIFVSTRSIHPRMGKNKSAIVKAKATAAKTKAVAKTAAKQKAKAQPAPKATAATPDPDRQQLSNFVTSMKYKATKGQNPEHRSTAQKLLEARGY